MREKYCFARGPQLVNRVVDALGIGYSREEREDYIRRNAVPAAPG